MVVKNIFIGKKFSQRIGHAALGLSVLAFLMSCGGTNGRLPQVLPKEMPYTVAVVFSAGFNPTEDNHYTVGEALHAELFNRVASVYQNTVEEFDIPAKGAYDRIIEFELREIVRDEHNQRLVNATDPMLPSRYIPLRFRISIFMASYDGEDAELVRTKVVKGIGESSSQEGVSIREGTGIASSSGPGSLDRAVAEAMENVCNGVTKLLIQGFVEPEKESKTSQ